MRIGSLFSGIGGLELGLERAGVGTVAWQCESDPYCRKVLAKHWPDVPRFEDIKTLKQPPVVEVICGGFPCQDISVAGRGDGLDGERSGLFFELMRVVRVVRPRLVILENVPALTSRGLGEVLGELAEAGFDAQWGCLSAAGVGAPHLRRRLFIIAYTHSDSIRHQPGWRRGTGWAGQGIPGYAGEEPRWEAPSSLCGTDDGVPHRVDRLRALGNAVVPQVGEQVGRLALEMIA